MFEHAIHDLQFVHKVDAEALRDAARNGRIDEPQFEEMIECQADRAAAIAALKTLAAKG